MLSGCGSLNGFWRRFSAKPKNLKGTMTVGIAGGI